MRAAYYSIRMIRDDFKAPLEICEEPLSRLAEHALVSSAFRVDRVLEVSSNTDLQAPTLQERAVVTPYIKNYDAIRGNAPADWLLTFDTSHWGLLAARVAGERVGGAVIAARTPELHLLGGREDVAVLWDLRVHPDLRGHGIGSALFSTVEWWATTRGYSQLLIETQDNNVRACRFYAGRGCRLLSVEASAYPEFPRESRLIWRKEL
jgi:GNAT superfamily N-acetyltransferase